MAIVKHTDTQLRIRFIPKLISMLFGFFILLLTPQLTKTLSPLTRAHILSCQRLTGNEGNCKLLESEFFKTELRKIPLAQMRKAQIIKIPVNNSESVYQQIVLLTQKGGVPLHFIHTDKSNLKTTELNVIALKINNFINDKKQNSLLVHQGTPFIDWVFAGIILLNIIWLAASSEVATWDFDSTRDSMIYKRRWLLFFSTTVEHSLTDIVSVDFEEKLSQGLKAYRVKLLIAKNQTLPLKICYGSYFLRQENTKKVREVIANFIKKRQIVSHTS